MTIEEFMERNTIKNRKTVEKWIEDGLLPCAKKNKKDEWVLSEYALPPYTASRAKHSKTACAIYKSIVTGCNQKRSVCAKIFGISDAEFKVYVDNLKKEGLIEVKKDKGCKFYFATSRSKEYLDNQNGLKKLIITLFPFAIEAAARGVTGAALDKFCP